MKKMIFAGAVLALLQITIGIYFINASQAKIAYADAIKLFNAYKFKTDMERSSQATLNRLKQEMDSVGVIYKVNPENVQAQQCLMQNEAQLQEGYNAINKEINEKVWERLNPLIQAYGKEHKIEMLIGANGMGTVLYASDSRDMTDAIIKYVNENYEKGN